MEILKNQTVMSKNHNHISHLQNPCISRLLKRFPKYSGIKKPFRKTKTALRKGAVIIFYLIFMVFEKTFFSVFRRLFFSGAPSF